MARPGGGRRGAVGRAARARCGRRFPRCRGRARGLHPAPDAWAAASDPSARPPPARPGSAPCPRGSASWRCCRDAATSRCGRGRRWPGHGRGALEPEEPALSSGRGADAGTASPSAVTRARRGRARRRASCTSSARGAWAARCPAPTWTWWRRCPARSNCARTASRVRRRCPGVTVREVSAPACRACGCALDGLDVDLAVVATGALDPGGGGGPPGRAGRGGGGRAQRGQRRGGGARRGGRRAPAFARLARQVKAWAKARGLDSAPFGGLPGPGLVGAGGPHGARGRRPAAADACCGGSSRRGRPGTGASRWAASSRRAGRRQLGPGCLSPSLTPRRRSAPAPTRSRRACGTCSPRSCTGPGSCWRRAPRSRGLPRPAAAPPPARRLGDRDGDGRPRTGSSRTRAGCGAGCGRCSPTSPRRRPGRHAWPRPFNTAPRPLRHRPGPDPADRRRPGRRGERRLRGLAGVTLTRAEGGEVPTLR